MPVDPHLLLEQRIRDRLAPEGRTVATAESCSGGLIAHRLTNVPGSSDVFAGGVVAYSNAIKAAILGVAEAVLETHGAVSEPVARQMAEGVRTQMGTDLGVGVTGIAGPNGGTPEKPVGLVFIAVADDDGTVVRKNLFKGTRLAVKEQTAEQALAMLWERIE